MSHDLEIRNRYHSIIITIITDRAQSKQICLKLDGRVVCLWQSEWASPRYPFTILHLYSQRTSGI